MKILITGYTGLIGSNLYMHLKEKGMEEGALIGKTLKLIEGEWLDNDFRISDEKVLKIIKAQNY